MSISSFLASIFLFFQANAGALLTQIEKEKELLRIFLRVSQMENTVLRRMNLPAFLMVRTMEVINVLNGTKGIFMLCL